MTSLLACKQIRRCNLQLVKPTLRSTNDQVIRHYAKRVPRGLQQEPKKIGIAGTLFLIAPISTFCLGVWQYNRRSWKISTIAELQQKVTKAEPVSFDLDEAVGVEYQKVQVTGSFDNSQEVLIGPRSYIDGSGGSGAGGIISFGSGVGDRVGYHVVTPFVVSGTGDRILVNRGWVPHTRLQQEQRPQGQISGLTTITGILRIKEETSSMVPPNKVETNKWHSRDLEALSTKLSTRPVFVDLDLESSRAAAHYGGPIGGQTRISLRNDHVQYMLTWFGMSAVTTLLWLKRFIW
eukprot:GFUD01004038.1.p1 GENE.GFUD01004038.1~~GFUD01004038.1.p1  ORF type:complete len:292 (-),score=54.34 GFUD01004038.1:26-901(-)